MKNYVVILIEKAVRPTGGRYDNNCYYLQEDASCNEAIVPNTTFTYKKALRVFQKSKAKFIDSHNYDAHWIYTCYIQVL
jgi:hypothetical protein